MHLGLAFDLRQGVSLGFRRIILVVCLCRALLAYCGKVSCGNVRFVSLKAFLNWAAHILCIAQSIMS